MPTANADLSPRNGAKAAIRWMNTIRYTSQQAAS